MVTSHYDARYFAWQKAIGEFGGWANLPKFAPYVSKSDSVLDFGCGGGYLLRNLPCARRMGVESSAQARAEATRNGVETFASVDEVPDETADKVISNHALEHVTRPLDVLIGLRRKLSPGGVAVFVVPCEAISCSYKPNDINNHLYSWSPMSLGNLFTEAGFRVSRSTAYIHKWPPLYRTIARYGRRAGFELACRVYGHLARSSFQVHVIAVK